MSLKNKIAIVTGGGRGIGAAVAEALAEAGAQTIVVSRTERELMSVAHQLTGKGLSCQHRVTDVASEASMLELFETTKRSLGPVDIVVNNAAIIEKAPIEEWTCQAFDSLIATNLRGTFLGCREAFRQMRGRGGSIINISSLAGLTGTEKFPGYAPYTASKFGVVGLTEALAAEGKKEKIRVNCVAPGAVDTGMLKKAASSLKTNTTPTDIARIVVFLADDSQSGALNGTTVPVYSNLCS